MPPHRTLDVYITQACFGCDRALELAAQVRGWELPKLTVQILDLGNPEVHRPDSVFAVPTWLLDGRVVSLGNPEVSWLWHLLRSDRVGGA